MTDSTQDPGATPDQPKTTEPETTEPKITEPKMTEPKITEPAGSESITTPAAGASPTDAAPTDAPTTAAPLSAAPATEPGAAGPVNDPNASTQEYASTGYPAEQPTAAYPTEQLGSVPSGSVPSGSVPPGSVPPGYVPPGSAPAGSVPPKEPRRKGSVALVAALALGALVGGASGAGVTALIMSGQGGGIPVSQSDGPSNVVVNNSESVNQITAVAAKASPSVVTISVASGQAGGTGSGVILSEDGYVLTNTHVVTLDGAVADARIQVTANDGKLYKATLVGTDPVSDLAVIKLTDASGLEPINWADSSRLNVGDTAIALGAPLGLAGTVTNGIVSALNRSITVASSAAPETPEQNGQDDGQDDGQNPFDFWNFDIPNEDGTPKPQAGQSAGSISLAVIQTDAAINPGNSGGALLNGKGELIGINVAIANAGGNAAPAAGSIGGGFAIPSNLAQRISKELIADGKATHGLLGASVTGATNDADSTTVGALINEVSAGGAAEKAGLQKGDIVTNFNDVPITDANDLTAQVRALAAGAKADLTYVRDGKSVTVSVTLGELSS